MDRQILNIAQNLCQAEENEQTLLTSLCTAASARLSLRLRHGIEPQDCLEAFCCAAALIAAAGMLECRASQSTWENFRAGDLSVTANSAGSLKERAELLRRQASTLLWPYEEDSLFCFEGVAG